ncbi:MAG: DNA repair protein RadA [Candidatus Saccharimonadales bacterium]
MAKTVTRFVCQKCGNIESRWSGKCTICGEWNTFIEETAKTKGSKTRQAVIRTAKLGEINKTTSKMRISTGIAQFDTVLGGGVVPGSLMLLAGEPGIGKSTLLLETADNISTNLKVLYVSGEESLEQIKLRAERLKVKNNDLELLATTSTDEIISVVESGNYNFVIVDSVQTMQLDDISSSAGTVSQISNSAQALQSVAKGQNTAVLLVGHVTKQGNIAGPKILEHLVDVVLYLEGEKFGNFKILRGIKNRFGSTNEVALFEMHGEGMEPVGNPSAVLLNERTEGDGSVVFPALEGSRAILVEVQALVSSSPFGYPKRTSTGFDLNRLNLLLAVLNKRAGINLGAHDVFINIVGGMKANEPAADLAVALAIASAYKSKAVRPDVVVFGELGLNGEVRGVSKVEERIKEARELSFKQAIAPQRGKANSFIKPVNNLAEAIKAALTN